MFVEKEGFDPLCIAVFTATGPTDICSEPARTSSPANSTLRDGTRALPDTLD
jgi:hypothetical protein